MSWRDTLRVLVAAGCLVGCGGSAPTQMATLDPTLLTATTPTEEAWLAALEAAQNGPVQEGELALGPTYHAASGRECRTLLPADGAPRLACKEQQQWFLVPRVFPSDLRGEVQ